MYKTIAGVLFFATQICLALYFNPTIDLIMVSVLGGLLLLYFVFRFAGRKYKE